jgi:hypothetical protein
MEALEQTRAPAVGDPVLREIETTFERQALDQELNDLPDKLRLPLVLHYLDGLTSRQVAERLDLSVDAIEGRLKQGRSQLRQRLARHGVGLAIAAAALECSQPAMAAASAGLVEGTARASLAWIDRQSLEACSANAVRLATTELATMAAIKTSTVVMIAAGLCLGSGAVGALGLQQAGSAGGAGGAGMVITAESGWESSAAGNESANAVLTLADTGDGDGGSDLDPFAAGVGSSSGLSPMSGRPPSNPMAAGMMGDSLGDATMTAPAPHYAALSKARRTAEESLDGDSMERVPLEFIETPLADALGFVSEASGLLITIDEESLSEYGVDPGLPITMRTTIDLTPRDAIEAVLARAGSGELDYIIRHGSIVVTTTEVADNELETVVYELRDLAPNLTAEEVMQLVQRGTSAVWVEDGGNASMAAMPGALMVRASQRTHREVGQLLEQLRRFAVRGMSGGASRDGTLMMEGDAAMYTDQTGGPYGLSGTPPASRIRMPRPLSEFSAGQGGFGGGLGGSGVP